MWWDGPYFHPKEFSADDVSAGLVDDLRVAKPDNKDPKCNAPAALSSAKKLFPSVEGWVPACSHVEDSCLKIALAHCADMIVRRHAPIFVFRISIDILLYEQYTRSVLLRKSGHLWFPVSRLEVLYRPGLTCAPWVSCRELPKDMGRRLRERGDAELARERWIAQLRSAPDLEEAGEVLAGGRRLQQDGRPHKGQEAEETAGGPGFLASNPGAWVDLGAPAGVPVGSGDLEEGSSGELSKEEAARLEELLALADAVRGDGGGGSGGSGGTGVGFVADQGEAAAAVAEALKPKLLNNTAAWSADTPNELVRVRLLLKKCHCIYADAIPVMHNFWGTLLTAIPGLRILSC